MTGWPDAGAHPTSHPDGACEIAPYLPVFLQRLGPRLHTPPWAPRRDPHP
ncbi:hypothetical protein [Paracoccus liaowanqingii]|nr:hypothetical protein [Paracoccus liaowanqingii]